MPQTPAPNLFSMEIHESTSAVTFSGPGLGDGETVERLFVDKTEFLRQMRRMQGVLMLAYQGGQADLFERARTILSSDETQAP